MPDVGQFGLWLAGAVLAVVAVAVIWVQKRRHLASDVRVLSARLMEAVLKVVTDPSAPRYSMAEAKEIEADRSKNDRTISILAESLKADLTTFFPDILANIVKSNPDSYQYMVSNEQGADFRTLKRGLYGAARRQKVRYGRVLGHRIPLAGVLPGIQVILLAERSGAVRIFLHLSRWEVDKPTLEVVDEKMKSDIMHGVAQVWADFSFLSLLGDVVVDRLFPVLGSLFNRREE